MNILQLMFLHDNLLSMTPRSSEKVLNACAPNLFTCIKLQPLVRLLANNNRGRRGRDGGMMLHR